MAEPVAFGVQTPDIFGKLSQILSIKAQRQGLEGQAAEVKSVQQSQRQREALSKYDFAKHLGGDGTPDLNSLMNDPELRAAAGDQFLEVITKAAGAKQQQLQNKQTLVGLRKDQRAAFGEMINALRSDADVTQDNELGRQKLNQAMVQYGEMYGEDALPVLSAYAGQLQKVPKGKLGDALRAIGLQTVSVENQLEKQQPQYLNTGGEFRDINPLTPPGQSKPSIPSTIPPGMSLFTDPRTGNPYVINPQTGAVGDLGGGIPGHGGVSPNTSPGTSTQPPSSLPAPMKPGEATVTAEQAKGISDRVSQTLEKADSSQQAIDALSRARTILDADLSTGKGFETIRNLSNVLAAVGVDTKGAEDANSLVKNLARYQASRAQAVGLGNTDAARELAEKGSPNTKIDREALKGVVTQSLAVEQALLAYSKIQSSVTDPQKLLKNEREFRSVPHLIQVYEYTLMRSPEEADKFLKKHGLGPDEIKKSLTKLRDLGAL